MILKKLNQIIEDDLNLLKENEVLESKTIEYKEELHLNSRDKRKELLADAYLGFSQCKWWRFNYWH